MRRATFHATGQRLRAPLLWVLIAIMPLGGMATLLTALLGSDHHHRRGVTNAVDSVQTLRDFRRVGPGGASARPVHHHALFQRHHHAPSDTDVSALDPVRDALATVAGGDVSGLVWAIAPWPAIVVLRVGAETWASVASCPLSGRTCEPPERPPRA